MAFKKTAFSLIVLLLACQVFGAVSQTYDTSAPDGGDSPKAGDNEIRAFKDAVQERQNDHNGTADEGDHYWPQTGTTVDDDDTGQHRMVTLRQLAANPSTLTSYSVITDLGFLFQKNVSGNGEAFYQDEAANVIQLTSGGEILQTSISDVPNDTYIKSVDNAGTGTANLIKADTNDEVVLGTIGSEIDMNSNGITGLAAADADTEAVHFGQWEVDTVAAAAMTAGTETIKYPNGVILKIGYTASGGNQTTVSFDDNFENAVISINITSAHSDSVAREPTVRTVTVGGFIIDQDITINGYYWQVWGH